MTGLPVVAVVAAALAAALSVSVTLRLEATSAHRRQRWPVGIVAMLACVGSSMATPSLSH